MNAHNNSKWNFLIIAHNVFKKILNDYLYFLKKIGNN